MQKPDKPSGVEIRVAEIVRAVSLKVEQRQTGSDTAETFWTVADWNGKSHEFKGGVPMSLIDYSPGWNWVFQVRPEILAKVKAWKEFEKSNEHELAEYKRLKAKFE